MLVVGFPSGAFQANCFAVAAGAGEACVIVDPGQDAVDPLADLLDKHRLTPVAVLATHGHFDHVFSVTPVCDGHDVPAWIHPADRVLLSEPERGLSAEAAAFFGGRFAMREPREVRELADGAVLDLAGLEITVDHTPGHTGGSVVFRTGSGSDSGAVSVLFSGDTLFAGSIGRTDLPGGDTDQIMESLRTKVLPLADDTVVLPGHGPQTTIGRERVSNPFLQQLRDGAGDRAGDSAPTAAHPRRTGL